MYVHAGTALLRQARMPISQAAPVPPEDTDPRAWRCWIEQAWSLPGMAEAICAASGDLARAVRRALSERPPASKDVVRAGMSLLQYVLRARYRATPFGLFAATTPVLLDGLQENGGDGREQVVVRADALWTGRLLARLHADPAIVEHLRVVAEPTCVLKGDHFEVPYTPGSTHPDRVRAKATAPMRETMALARRPVGVTELVDRLLAERPDVARSTVVTMIAQALCSGLLHSDLHPATTQAFALQHLHSRLKREPCEQAATVCTALGDMASALAACDGSSPEDAAQIEARMNDLAGGDSHPLMYDVHRPDPVHLPPTIADDVATALEAMARMSSYPQGSPSWQEYRARFFDRYSLGVLVPLRELLDPAAGLGYPAGYRDSPWARRELALTARDHYLLARVQRLDRSRSAELVLSEDDLEALHVGDAAQVWATTEATVCVHAESRADLDRGDYELVLEGLSSSLGVLTGRFLPLMSGEEQSRHIGAHRSAPTLARGAVRVQVGSPPLRHRVRNVTGTIQLVPDMLALGEYGDSATMFADEIAVAADAEHLYLVHAPTMRRIEPFLANAVEPTAATHPLARFLTELPRSHTAVLTPFDWGAAATLPFLPRVRHGRVVLSPARWLLSHQDLHIHLDPARAVRDWADREQVPHIVSAGEADNRLRLDLRLHAHRLILARLLKDTPLPVREEPEDGSHGWLGHAGQVTLGFASDQPQLPAPVTMAGPVRLNEAGLRVPGCSRHLLLRIDAPMSSAHEVFASGLADLLEREPVARWWFTRYRDPEEHLRVRITLNRPQDFAAIAEAVGCWAGQAHRDHLAAGLSWHVDLPEIGRYGTGEALDAAEEAFARDSACVLLQDDPVRTPAQREALLIVSLIDIAGALLGDDEALNLWEQTSRPTQSWPAIDRETRTSAMRLCEDPARGALLDLHDGHRLAAAWQTRSKALRAYANVIRGQDRPPRAVLPALVHMHHCRAFGVDANHEQLAHHQARQIAHSVLVRRAATR